MDAVLLLSAQVKVHFLSCWFQAAYTALGCVSVRTLGLGVRTYIVHLQVRAVRHHGHVQPESKTISCPLPDCSFTPPPTLVDCLSSSPRRSACPPASTLTTSTTLVDPFFYIRDIFITLLLDTFVAAHDMHCMCAQCFFLSHGRSRCSQSSGGQ